MLSMQLRSKMDGENSNRVIPKTNEALSSRQKDLSEDVSSECIRSKAEHEKSRQDMP